MKPWPDALSGAGILLRQWLPGLARRRSHVSHHGCHAVTPPVRHGLRQRRQTIRHRGHHGTSRRRRHSDPRVRSVREIGARVTRRAFARFERGNSQTRTSYRRWTTARARGDPPRAEAAEDAREEAPRSPERGRPSPARAAPAPTLGPKPTATPPNANARAHREPGVDSFAAGGDSTVVAAWTKTRGKGRTIRPGAGAGRGCTIGDEDSDDGGGGGGSGAAFEGERRAEAWVRGGGRYDRGFASPDQPAPSMTRRRAYGSHSQDRLDEFHRS